MNDEMAEYIAAQLRRIADMLEQIVAAQVPKFVNMSDAERAIASQKFIDAADVDCLCKAALRRETICDAREITKERFRHTRGCGDKTIDRLIAFRDRLIGPSG